MMVGMETVGSAMLRHPTVHPADLTVGEAQAVFAARAKTHLLVLVEHLRLTNPHHFVPEHQPRRRAEPHAEQQAPQYPSQ